MSIVTFKYFLAEASRGIDKWEKYFGANTETRIKTDTDLLNTDGKKVGTIAKGELITVQAGEYDTKPLIIYKDGIYRVKFNDIDKPFKKDFAVKVNLKPDVLGLDGTSNFKGFKKKVKKAIDDSTDIPANQGQFLKALVDHAADPNDADAKDEVIDLYENLGIKDDMSFQSTVNNDFMEILGPFFVVNEKPEYANGDVIFPSAGNEPLFDFEMEIEDPVKFSSKRSGGRTNTLKVDQIWKSVQDNPYLLKKYAREMQVLEIIKTSMVKDTPEKLNTWLAATFKGKYTLAPTPTTTAEIYSLESAVIKWIKTQSKLDFLPLIKNAIPDLWYVKAKMNFDGTIKVEPLKNTLDIDKTELRSKNYSGRLGDKLGFEV
jgi:hypothetical protein